MTGAQDRPIRVLLVEDNPGDQRLAVEGLSQGGHRRDIVVAANAEEALDYLKGKGTQPPGPQPDLALVDLNLPGRDGREVLSEIKGDPGLRRIPVVILSSSAAPEDIDESYGAGANCYVQKPTDLDELMQVLGLIDAFWLTTALLPQG